MYSIDDVAKTDKDIADLIEAELARQNSHIELIASENWVSKAVMAAMGSPLTNKYAEGYPGKRFYGGCSCVDEVEALAIERAKELFGCEYANVQPHSGAQANMAVFFAMLQTGDTVMGMNLDHGGHLTHGSPANMSGTYFKPVYYGVNDDGVIDYEEVRRIAIENKPKLIVAGASAYARVIDFKKFREIADEVGAYLMVDMAHIAGLVAGGQHPSPIPYADVVTTTTHKTLRGPRGGLILSSAENAKKFNFNKAVFPGIQGGPLMHVIAAKAVCFKEALQPEFKDYAKMIVENAQALCKGLQKRGIDIVSGGTDNHLMLVDLRSLGVTGKQMENLLDEVNITCNKNAIPNDPQSPFVTSGVRLGTAAVTSRGMKPEDMDKIAEAIAMTLKEEGSQEKAKAIVKELTDKYPQTNHCSCLPVAFCTESIAFFHKSLDCKSGKLFKSTQISKVCNDCLIIFLFQEFLKSDLNLSLNCYMTFKFFRISSLKKNIIFAVVFIYQRIYITFSYIFYIISNLIYRISINFPSEFDLCFYFITFCNSYVSHVICYTTYADMAALHDTNCSTHPGCQTLLDLFVCPVSCNDFSLDSHAGYHMAKLTAAVCGLVLIHKVHINGIIGDFHIELCMKMAQRFAILFKAKDPGFCRGKCVHPRDHAGTVFICIGIIKGFTDQLICDQRWFPYNLKRKYTGFIQFLYDDL